MVKQAGRGDRDDARRLMTHPGVGPQTALGMVLTVGQVNRFATSKQLASYLGLTPRRHEETREGQAAAGTHQQTGIQLYALPAGGSGPGGGARR